MFYEGQKIEFDYVDRSVVETLFGPEVKNETEHVKGKVVKVRNIESEPIKSYTKKYNPIDRSQFLVTLRLTNGKYKNFYHGRMINVKNRTSIIKRIARTVGLKVK